MQTSVLLIETDEATAGDVRALLQRAGYSVTSGRQPENHAQARLCVAGLELNRLAHRVWASGTELGLTPIEYRILVELMLHAGAVVERDDLMQAVWGAARSPGSNALAVHIAHLRRKLAASGAQLHTFRGRGYLLECER